MMRTFTPIAALGFALTSGIAHAIPCQEVANMLNAGVPANIVASAIRDSGARYTASDISCLSKAGAPANVLQIARSMTGSAIPETQEAPAARQPDRRSIDSDSDLMGSRQSSRRNLADEGTESQGQSPSDV